MKQIVSPWTNSRFRGHELDGKSVNFAIRDDESYTSGIGHFIAYENPEHQVSVQIRAFIQPLHWPNLLWIDIDLPQQAVDLIQANENKIIRQDFILDCSKGIMIS